SIRRQGQQEVQDLPYGYGRFANGVVIPDLARRALRRVDPEGVRWPDPFATAGPDSFFDWLRQPADGDEAIPLPRLALLLWDHRDDLQRIFVRPWAEDRLSFAEWFVQSAASAERIDPAFTARLERTVRLASIPAKQTMTRLTSLTGPPAMEGELGASKIAWLAADAGHEPRQRPRVSRLALEMHRQRTDLLRAYPDPLGADRKSLALWFVTSGRHEYQLPKAVVNPVLRTLPWRQRAWARLWWERQRRRGKAGVQEAIPEKTAVDEKPQPAVRAPGPAGFNVIGWSTSPTGVGEACRGTLAALELAGLGSALWPLDDGALAGLSHGGLPYEVSLYHVNADMMETVDSRLPRGFTTGRHRIGYWFWELAHFPVAFARAFRHTDEVWAPSRFCQQAFQSLATVEVRWAPPCVVPATAAPASRESLGIDPESFLFFFAFDALSVPERKNPGGLLAAFTRVARESRRPVHLLMKVNHAETEPGFIAEIRSRCAGLPVTLLTGTLSRGQLDGLTAACDAYVSLHRSEGLGLPLIEAMYMGKPVIATGYGGVTDFLDETTGFPVGHSLVRLERDFSPYPAGAVWAEPDLDD
ncbi:MAG TPA: glycosyltransferase, partial [Thermoanaerobaculia bacterium]|nr:glycosyltransferase [Thermoanaerobaculia bacterium]